MLVGEGNDRIVHMLECLGTDKDNSVHIGTRCVVAESPEIERRD